MKREREKRPDNDDDDDDDDDNCDKWQESFFFFEPFSYNIDLKI